MALLLAHVLLEWVSAFRIKMRILNEHERMDVNNDLVESVEVACVAEVYGRGVIGANELRLLPGSGTGGGA